MAETLFIRLGSQPQDNIHWLVWSGANSEIIASGELGHAGQLSELSEKAQNRPVTVFVPGCDVSLRRLKVPGKSGRAVRQAVPYMLEDDLAQDVEQLFFAYGNVKEDEQGNNCFAAVVDREQMSLWQSWLADAGIRTKHIIPDVLAMPLAGDAGNGDGDTSWSAVALGEQVLVRQGQWQGVCLDNSIWPLMCDKWQQAAQVLHESQEEDEEDEDSGENEHENGSELQQLYAYSPLDCDDKFDIRSQPEELPLALLAQNVNPSLVNLLQGEFQQVEPRSQATVSWLWAAGIALFALVLNVGIKGAALMQVSNQQEAVEQQIIATYKQAFPATKRVRVTTIKSQLKQKLAELGPGNSGGGFLEMLSRVQPAFASVPGLKPASIKFDSKRQELRLQALASDYQQFDKFKSALEKARLTVNLGAQSNQGEQISGSFSIKG
ncbi:type II secretion system protein GspL [Thalassomonas viridans]|uniref:Type II secretion system protein L n=1 Tax=Thalassomonas viridans TaxID=137584 RepID=A0AAE9Z3Y7_9GAMM|nr:type II secretion system protein GspL [Thalassomonas viridans]WDE05630.1 type II secretion system protein GspL [Thalassomonas viridans]